MFSPLRSVALFASLIFATAASAADGDIFTSEYLHQAGAGAFEFTPGLGQAPGNITLIDSIPNGFNLSSYNVRGSDVKFNISSLPLVVAGEYGINSMFAVGVELAYGTGGVSFTNCPSGGSCPSQTIKGLYDPVLYFKGQAAVGAGSIQYGVIAQVNVEKSKTNASGDSNFATGGSAVSPFVAYQMPVATGAWGARLRYELYKGDRKTTDDSSNRGDETQSGGNAWSFDTFYEAPVGIATLGASLFYVGTPSTKTSISGSTAVTDNNSGHSTYGVEFYAPIHFSSVTLLPNIAYAAVNFNSSQQPFTSGNIYQLGCAARMTF